MLIIGWVILCTNAQCSTLNIQCSRATE